MPGFAPDASHVLFVILPKIPEGNIISTVLQMSKVKHTEVARLAQDFTSVEKEG